MKLEHRKLKFKLKKIIVVRSGKENFADSEQALDSVKQVSFFIHNIYYLSDSTQT